MPARRRSPQVLRGLVASLVATLVGLAAVELLVRGVYLARASLVDTVTLPYAVGHRYLVPPWGDGVRLLEPDPVLLWRNRPGVRRRYLDVFGPIGTEAERARLLARFLPTTPAALRDHPTWGVAINSLGFRGGEFPPRRREALRIVCLGDSWTFGANVDQENTYPARLEALLRQRFPDAGVDVMNLGVMGYSSFQGRELLRRRALALEPDVVVLAFGMNDSSVAGFRDADLAAAPPPGPGRRALEAVGRLEALRLLAYAAQRLTRPGDSLAEHLRAADESARSPGPGAAGTTEDYAEVARWTRVPLDEYRDNVSAMVGDARRHGAAVVLLFNELWAESPYAAAMADVGRRAGVPVVDGAALLARERRRLDAEREASLGLRSSARVYPGESPDAVEVVLRLRPGGRSVPRGLFVVGAHPALGGLVPNRVALRDDGREGDERAGDGVWSHVARLPPGTRAAYVYTNSGREGRWGGSTCRRCGDCAPTPVPASGGTPRSRRSGRSASRPTPGTRTPPATA